MMSNYIKQPTAIYVVKLGGSLLHSPSLKAWLDMLSFQRLRGCHIVMVAGGGIFADAIRDVQTSVPFSDQAAHHMALLAMQQYAILLQDLHPKYVLFNTMTALTHILYDTHQIPIWSPLQLCMQHTDEIACTWEMTSDSLSAWLATRLAATHLILVKAADCPSEFTLQTLADNALVDPLFPKYAKDLSVKIFSQHQFSACADCLI